MPECSIVQKSWSQLTLEELYSVLKLRTDVFFVEQRIDEEELDNRDQEATTEHLWIADASGAAAYLRVLVDAEATHLDARHIVGRVVVRADRRGEGLAQLLVGRVMEQHGHESMLLHAQDYIAPLYAKFGFESFGDKYIEAGIPHISMYRARR
ncbi:GNAT family N-acetyltransferase [Lacisediminihabitans sp. H27-G8]|uniref:GNAT family N-acetyltransferase n=1 Tax=Lacisediminihabitans sp. H27-G8 TaxID=3111909 RepID=UPI0038FCE0B5